MRMSVADAALRFSRRKRTHVERIADVQAPLAEEETVDEPDRTKWEPIPTPPEWDEAPTRSSDFQLGW